MTPPSALRSGEDDVAEQVRALELRLAEAKAAREQPLKDLAARREQRAQELAALEQRAIDLERSIAELEAQNQEVQLRPGLSALAAAVPTMVWVGGVGSLLLRSQFVLAGVSTVIFAAVVVINRRRRDE